MIDQAWTLRNEQRDFVEWHRGRGPYVLWALDVDTPAVRRALASAAAHLAGWLLPDYNRQPHVTLDLCGFPSQGYAIPADDEFSLADLLAHCEAVAAQFPPPFVIEIGELASFSSAPYLQVRDPEAGLRRARAALARAQGGSAELRNGSHNDYVPHVTVGLYGGAWPAAAVNASLRAYRNPPSLRMCIDRLSLLAYQPQEIGGSLHPLGEFCLNERCWRPASGERYF